MNKIEKIYHELLKEYGPQGWWPLLELDNSNPVNITKSGSIKGYHPNDYSYPKTENQMLEICIGSIITQNTSWIQVEKALNNLNNLNALNIKGLRKLSDGKVKEMIKVAGYYNQKGKKIRLFAEFFYNLNGKIPTRKELLDIWGVGEETADSMLLYAFKVPTFVVDTYTKRIFTNLGLIDKKAKYEEIKDLFEKSIKPDLIIYQEYHALIAEHAKRYYAKKMDFRKCPLFKKFKSK